MMTDGARYAPRRTELPPGTIRTLSSTVNFLTGMVSLSMNGNWPSDISVSVPSLKPSRMASFIQAFTFQFPSTFSATRMRPDSKSAQKSANCFLSIIIYRSMCLRTSFISARVDSVASVNGSLISASHSPSMDNAAFTGIGLHSTKHAWKSGYS